MGPISVSKKCQAFSIVTEKVEKRGPLRAPLFPLASSSLFKSTAAYGQPPDVPAIWPETLLKVQVALPQFVCVAVIRKVLVPTAPVTVTPVVGLNPGGVPVVIVPPLYVEFAAK